MIGLHRDKSYDKRYFLRLQHKTVKELQQDWAREFSNAIGL
jgi:hypothetical protein